MEPWRYLGRYFRISQEHFSEPYTSMSRFERKKSGSWPKLAKEKNIDGSTVPRSFE